MGFDINKAVRFIFDDKDWIMKVGLLIVLQIFLGLVSAGLNFTSNFVPGIEPSFGIDNISTVLAIMVPMFALGGIGLITFPVQMYITGFTLETTLNTMNGEETPLPSHNNFAYKIKLWFGQFLIILGPGILLTALAAMIAVPAALILGMTFYDLDTSAPFVMFGLILGIFFLIFLGFLLNTFIVSPMLYLYLSTGSIARAYDIGAVISLAKRWWKEFLVVVLFKIAIGMVVSFLEFIACLFGPIVSPALKVIGGFIGAHLMGQAFGMIKQSDVLPNVKAE